MFQRLSHFHRTLKSLFLGIVLLISPVLQGADTTAQKFVPGMTVDLVRDEPLRFLDKVLRTGKEGESFKVLEYRPASNQIFLGVEQGGKLTAVWVPPDAVALDKKAATPTDIQNSDSLFSGQIPLLTIRISPEGIEKLRQQPKVYVEGTLEETGGAVIQHVGIKLKGSVGSFKPIDDRPGFSINTAKYKNAHRFHGLSRFQLNNCNQDNTALNEVIAGQIARKAGVPASRCTHAIVSLNGRPLGVYVLKEAFRDELIGAFFPRTDGHLYDGGFCAEVRQDMELDQGDETNQERLTELVKTLAEGDPVAQLNRLEKVVDVEAYLRYFALENILCHWDGYSFNRNNYRLYENPDTGRFHFFLHGMDQMFGDAKWSLWRTPQAAVGSILWRKPEIRARYDVILREICETQLLNTDWAERADQIGKRVKTALALVNAEQAKAYEPRIAEEKERIRNRMANIQRQLKAGNPAKRFESNNPVELASFDWNQQMENAQGDEVTFEKRQCLHIKATGDSKSSWRLPVFLPQGIFRFEAEIRTSAVEKITDPSGDGAGLRSSGSSRQGKNGFEGSVPWTKVIWEFESKGAEHTLIAELRAKAGELWIDRKSLRLVRIR